MRVLGLLAGLWISCGTDREEDLLPRLADAVGSHRFAALRTTGGFGWAACEPAESGDALIRGLSCIATLPADGEVASHLAGIRREIRRRAGAGASPATLHADGLWQLIGSARREAVARSIELIERARELAPSAADVANDLAVAYSLRASVEQTPFDLIRCLRTLDRAVALDPDLAEGWLNRARILAELGLRRQALAAARRFAELEPEGPWRQELDVLLGAPAPAEQWQERRDELLADAARRGAIDGYHQQVRELVEELLLVRWPQAMADGDRVEASRLLDRARELALDLAAAGGDRLLIDAGRFLDRRDVRDDPRTVAAHRDLGRAIAAFEGADFEDAEARAAAAERALEALGSPFHHWATFYRASCRHLDGDYAAAAALLSDLVERPATASYPVLCARVLWVLGLTFGVRGEVDPAVALHRRSLALFEHAGERPNAAVMHFLLAENLQDLGEYDRAWSHRLRALHGVAEVRQTYRRHNVFYEAADAVRRQGAPEVALHFYQEMVEQVASDDPISRVETLVWRAETRLELADWPAAADDLRRARQETERIHDASIRHRLEADVALVSARLESEVDPAAAVASLDAAEAVYAGSGFRRYLPVLRLTRARARERLGQPEAAREDYRATIAAYEELRATLPDLHQRALSLDEARPAFDRLAVLELDRFRDPESAFDVAESARARMLIDLQAGAVGTARPLAQGAIRRRLPAGTALVEYAVLEGRIVAWMLTRERLDPRSIAASPDRVRTLAASLEPDGGISRSEQLAALSELHELLIAPIEDRIAPADLLVIAPDGVLRRVPFAALRDRSGSHLIERCTIAISPGATAFLQAGERRRALGEDRPTALLGISDPAFAREDYPTLGRLPAAGDEVAAVARLYPEPEILAGTEATARRFLELAGSYQVIHFAGHGLANAELSLRSRLVFARDPAAVGSGALYADEILGRRFARTRLVVLAACATARGPVGRAEGTLGLATPFLAGGVPAVVATLWRVDDRASARLLASFHRRYAAGTPAAEALRAAQIEALADSDGDFHTWAAYQLIGGPS